MTPLDKVKIRRAGDIQGIMRRLEREGWRLLEKDRDNWRARALAYKDTLRKMQGVCAKGGDEVIRYQELWEILKEAEKIKE